MTQPPKPDKRGASPAAYLLLTALLLTLLSCARIPTQQENNVPCFLQGIQTDAVEIHPGETFTFTIITADADADSLSATWRVSSGNLLYSSIDSARWQSPDSTQLLQISCQITDPDGAAAADTAWYNNENRNPVISGWGAAPQSILTGNEEWFTLTATDPDSQEVLIDWEVSCGTILENDNDSLLWLAPDSVTQAWISASVSDDHGGAVRDTARVEVYRELGSAWICNQGDGEVVKLSSRGAELLRVDQFIEPVDLSLDAENRRLWVIDREEQLLWRLSYDGERLDSLYLGGRPEAVSAVPQDGSCWIADSDSSFVRRIAADGTTVLNTVRGFSQPVDLSINPWSGELWVCDRSGGSLHRIDPDLPEETTINDTSLVKSMCGFQLPVSLAVEPQSGACWLVDRQGGAVYRVEADLSDSLQVSDLDDPLAVAVASETGQAWISDGGADGSVSKLFYDNVQFRLTGLAWPRSLAVDFNSGNCWIPETEQNQLLRYSPTGQLLSTTTGFNYPAAVVLNRGF